MAPRIDDRIPLVTVAPGLPEERIDAGFVISDAECEIGAERDVASGDRRVAAGVSPFHSAAISRLFLGRPMRAMISASVRAFRTRRLEACLRSRRWRPESSRPLSEGGKRDALGLSLDV